MSGDGSSAHRVLIVGSDDAIRRLLGLALESFGCEPYQARDGPEVLNILRSRSMCAVIVDVPGPGTSCWPMMNALGRPVAGRRPATIAMSTDTRALAVAGEFGVDTTLRMPFSLDHLQATLEGLVAREGSAHRPTTPLRPFLSRRSRLAGFPPRGPFFHHAVRI